MNEFDRRSLPMEMRIAGGFSVIAVLIAVAFSLFGFYAQAQSENPRDILVIANERVKSTAIGEDDLRDIFLKRRLDWPSGGRAVPFNAPLGTELRNDFRSRILGMTESEEVQYWQARKIRAGVTPPPEMNDTRKAVFRLRGAVSYIYRDQYKEGVAKILLVVSAQ